MIKTLRINRINASSLITEGNANRDFGLVIILLGYDIRGKDMKSKKKKDNLDFMKNFFLKSM